MRFRVKRFYRSKKDFEEFYFGLKQTPCPHCGYIGTLILHGYLYGYDEKIYSKRIIRGHRIFCSNRGRRCGCGRTFSLLKSNILKGFNITAGGLWRFLKGLSAGMNKMNSFKNLDLPFSNTTIYRLYKDFVHYQSRLRTLLLKICRAPQIYHENNPVIQTILHLKSAFKRSLCPVRAFQEHFQASFL